MGAATVATVCHALATVATFFLLRSLVRHDVGAALGALFWLVAAVRSADGRSAASGCLGIAALCLYLLHLNRVSRSHKGGYAAAATASYGAAVLCDAATTLSLPLMAATLGALWPQRRPRPRQTVAAAWLAAGMLYLLIAPSPAPPAAAGRGNPAVAAMILLAATAVTSYAGRLWRAGVRWPGVCVVLFAVAAVPPAATGRGTWSGLYLALLGPALATAVVTSWPMPPNVRRAVRGAALAVIAALAAARWALAPR
jgi:hypothetical protein